jgi:hypothetical protein
VARPVFVARAGDQELVDGIRLRICSAEDLVVLKAFAGRHIDWADIERVVARVGSTLDTELIVTEAGGFVSDYSGRGSAWQSGSVVAGNSDIQNALVSVLGRASAAA